jgi:pSer/pThr/pTyr-binding forkhead associated (FHA) protein
MKIGRAHEAEIRINDISVSRNHALIKLVDNEVYLADLKSKFGTLVLLQ